MFSCPKCEGRRFWDYQKVIQRQIIEFEVDRYVWGDEYETVDIEADRVEVRCADCGYELRISEFRQLLAKSEREGGRG